VKIRHKDFFNKNNPGWGRGGGGIVSTFTKEMKIKYILTSLEKIILKLCCDFFSKLCN
jgi:hypothetical protein